MEMHQMQQQNPGIESRRTWRRNWDDCDNFDNFEEESIRRTPPLHDKDFHRGWEGIEAGGNLDLDHDYDLDPDRSCWTSRSTAPYGCGNAIMRWRGGENGEEWARSK
jgi:hypothetical protein